MECGVWVGALGGWLVRYGGGGGIVWGCGVYGDGRG